MKTIIFNGKEQKVRDDIENYITDLENKNVKAKTELKIYKDLGFKEELEYIVEKDRIISTQGIVFSKGGTPRFKTSLGYVTTNKKFVELTIEDITKRTIIFADKEQKVREDIENYIIDLENKNIKAKSVLKIYKDLGFKEELEYRVEKNRVFPIQEIVFSSGGTPRFKTQLGYVTTNKKFVELTDEEIMYKTIIFKGRVQKVRDNIEEYILNTEDKNIIALRDLILYEDLGFKIKSSLKIKKGTIFQIDEVIFSGGGTPRFKILDAYISCHKNSLALTSENITENLAQCFISRLDTLEDKEKLLVIRYLYSIGKQKDAFLEYKKIDKNSFSRKDILNYAILLNRFGTTFESYLFLLTLPIEAKERLKSYEYELLFRASSLIKAITFSSLIYSQDYYSGIKITENVWTLIDDSLQIVDLNRFHEIEIKYIMAYINLMTTRLFYDDSCIDINKKDEILNKIAKSLQLEKSGKIYKYLEESLKYLFIENYEKPKSLDEIDENLELWQTLALERLFALLGFLSTSYFFRILSCKIAINDFLEDKSIKYTHAKRAICAAVELDDDEVLKELYLKIHTMNYNDEQYNKLLCFYNLMTGKVKDAQKNFEYFSSPKEKEYLHLFENKTVALVAPAPTEYENGQDIDTHDYVLRTSTLIQPQNLDIKKYGSRTDIGSFNTSDIRADRLDNFNIDDISVKFAIFKQETWIEEKDILEENNNFCIIETRSFVTENFSLQGVPNHLPDMAMYLLMMSSRPSLFSANFFLSANAYAGDYRNQPSLHNLIIGGDNLILGHKYARRLYKLDLIKVDKETQRVLDLDTSEYISQMEDMYQDTIRLRNNS